MLKSLWGKSILAFGMAGLLGSSALAQKSPISKIKEEIQVGGADVRSRPLKGVTEVLCDLKSHDELTEIRFNTLSGQNCLQKIKLSKNDLSRDAILSFYIRGEKDVQNFKIGLEAKGTIEYVGSILEYLPQSVITAWSQVGIALREFKAKGVDLEHVEALVLNFHDAAEGKIEMKKIEFAPQKPGTENWEAVTFALPEFEMKSITEFKTIAIGHFGQEFGWKVAQVYREIPKQSFASGKISLTDLKAERPALTDGVLRIADFDRGLENNLGGHFNEFLKLPSEAFVTLTPAHHRGLSGRSLQIDYQKRSKGYSGVWIHFFDLKKPPLERVYFDSADVEYLSFWVKGERGKEDVSVQLADARWEKIEDSVYYGEISQFLPHGVTTEWQEVKIPLKKHFYKNLRFNRLAGLIFTFRQQGQGTLYIEDVSFLKSPEKRVPASYSVEGKKRQPKPLTQAIWIWHTDRQLKDKKAQAKFFKFCKSVGVNMIFFQLQYELQKQKDGTYQCLLKYIPELKRFIAKATALGIEVQALDGFSRFALRPWHDKVLAQIRAIIAYNKEVRPSEQFSGIHHDNEPYLIPTYWGRVREDVMHQYFELCEKSQKLVRESGLKNFEFGVDIPFWYEELNFDYDVPVEVTWKGKRQPASFHIIDIVDNVGIMDYRTKAYGADGTIVHGRDEIGYANRVGKKVLVGLETYPLPHEIFSVFRYDRYAYLTELSRKIHHDPRMLFMMTDQYQGLGILYFRRMRDDLQDTPEKIEAEIKRLKIDFSETVYQSDISVDVLASKLSFAGMDKNYFTKIHQETIDYFYDDPSFVGTAIHYYETYEKLMEL